MSNMDTYTERNAAAELAERIDVYLIDPAMVDQLKRPPEDRPPQYADWLMSETTGSIERDAHVEHADWELIFKALEHYAGCTNVVTVKG